MKLNVLNPPSRVASSHTQILERANIQDCDEGPIVVTALIATRADDDIEKAMREAKVPGWLKISCSLDDKIFIFQDLRVETQYCSGWSQYLLGKLTPTKREE